jgi:hypothetical protein
LTDVIPNSGILTLSSFSRPVYHRSFIYTGSKRPHANSLGLTISIKSNLVTGSTSSDINHKRPCNGYPNPMMSNLDTLLPFKIESVVPPGSDLKAATDDSDSKRRKRKIIYETARLLREK